MNIFDFENRVKSASNNQHHDLDMDSLLNDLNLGTDSPRRRIAFLPYFGVMAIALTGALVFFTYSLKFDDTASLASQINTNTEIKATAQEAQINEVKSMLTANKETLSTEIHTSSQKQIKVDPESVIKSINAAWFETQTKKSIANTTETRKKDTSNTTTEAILATKNINEQIIHSHPIAITSNELPDANKTEASNLDQKQAIAVDQTEQSIKIEVVAELPQLHIILADDGHAELGLKPLNKKVSDCPKFSEGNWNLAIVPEAGLLIPIKSLSLKDANFDPIFEDRTINESSQLSFQTGIGIEFRNKITGLYIRPGFNYSRIDETFTNEDTRFVTNEVQYQLHQYNIPVAIGTDIDFKKFTIGIEGGIVFNFLQRANGQIYDGKIISADFPEGHSNFVQLDRSQSLFKQSIGLGFFGGAMLKTQLNSRSKIYAGPRFSFNTLSASSNQNPIDQRYSFIGVHAGVIYTLF